MEKKLKKNREYWSRRFEALEDTQLQRSEDYLKRVDEAYKRSSAQLQKDINYWYSRLAKNNDISLTEARKLLSKDELKEFHWSVEEYIEKGKTLNISDEWAKALENASAKRHISRLEAMQTQMRAEVEQLYGGISEDTEKLLGDIYSDQYYRSIFELEKGIGIATTFEKIDKRSIEKALSKPWTTDGRTFSDRLWSNKASLITTLQTELTQAIIQGKNPQTIVDVIAKKVGETDKKKMERLVMTESAYIAQNGQRDAYKSIGVEEFEVLATLDSKTSEICRAMDGKHFPMSQYEIGITAPPFHPWCRSTTVPYFDDEFTVDEQRAMRDPKTGEYQTVPTTMKYGEWYDKYVSEDIKRSIKIQRTSKPQYERYVKVLGDLAPNSYEEFVDIKTNDPVKYGTLKHQYRVVNMYEDNQGNMEKLKIVELHDKNIQNKRDFTGNARKKANVAIMELDGQVKIANSQINERSSPFFQNFGGNKDQIVFLPQNERFHAIVVGSHNRYMDSEKKLLEYASTIADDGKPHVVNLLSEKCMCESCQGVLSQFTKACPNVKINVVSNKKERAERNKNQPYKYLL